MNHHLLRCCFALQQSITPPAISVAKRMHLHHRFNLSFNRRVSISNINKSIQSVITMSAHRERRISGSSDGNHISSNNTEIQIINAEETARKKRSGQARRRMEKAARRENRIAQLQIIDNKDDGSSDNSSSNNNNNNNGLTDSERAELEGLLQTRENFEEQYDADNFSEEHIEFKRLHNEAFAALARFCQRDRNRKNIGSTRVAAATDANVFYLDGPDTATTLALIDKHGFDPSRCYVANRHLSTCKILQKHLPEENVIHATAAEALSPPSAAESDGNNNGSHDNDSSFSDIDFACYYFDGCGGFTPHIIGMMSAALIRPEATKLNNLNHSSKTIAVGYSLMGGNKDVIEKEMDINRALSNIAHTRGMRTRHVLDDPWRYGIPAEIAKTEGSTFTSWIILEEEDMMIL